MTETIEATKVVKEVELKAVLCDRCGKDFFKKLYESEGTHFELHFGYGSRFDDEWWSFDCCDDCAAWLKSEFKDGSVE